MLRLLNKHTTQPLEITRYIHIFNWFTNGNDTGQFCESFVVNVKQYSVRMTLCGPSGDKGPTCRNTHTTTLMPAWHHIWVCSSSQATRWTLDYWLKESFNSVQHKVYWLAKASHLFIVMIPLLNTQNYSDFCGILSFRIYFKICLLVDKALNGVSPSYLSDLLLSYEPSTGRKWVHLFFWF